MAKRKKNNSQFLLGFLTGILVGIVGFIFFSYVLSQYFANLF